MMIDFAIEAQRSGKNPPPKRSRKAACCASVDHDDHDVSGVASLPIALGLGAGAKRGIPWPGLVGGLVVFPMSDAYITPVIYLYMESFQAWFKRPAKPQTSRRESMRHRLIYSWSIRWCSK